MCSRLLWLNGDDFRQRPLLERKWAIYEVLARRGRVTEPPDEVRGDAARSWFYMVETYAIKITAAQQKLFVQWAGSDPVDEWERLRNKRIAAAQGNTNPHVK